VKLRFDILTLATGPFVDIAQRWKGAEEMGFHGAWLVDTLSLRGTADYEPWSLLGALASTTSRLRIGTLVSQITFRHPVLLAAQAITVDRISDGRLELGIGAGDYIADNAAVGVEAWPLSERLDRLEEQLVMVDKALRGERFDHQGRFHSAEGVHLAAPVQHPRPPLVIAGQVSGTLRLAARFADVWNTLGGQPLAKSGRAPIPLAQAVERTREQVRLLDHYCHELGRNPGELRRSVLPYRAETEPLSSLAAFDDFVGRYAELGFEQFIFYWPPVANQMQHQPISTSQQATLEKIAAERIANP
jgi:alkanesulfonate monooxygenase SsuD/methylene tetrahydromethanopterin reductase-like flavin-dependent oxidoreductase (luciferase family)